MSSRFDITEIRAQFPALARRIRGQPAVYFDGPAGSQVPQRVITAVSNYLAGSNANTHGLFATSQETDDRLSKARHAAADLFGTSESDAVVFGLNTSQLALSLGRALSRTWGPEDEILVTDLDHDSNVSSWTLAARDAGAQVNTVSIDPSDCTLDLKDFEAKLNSRTRFVAISAASNAVGTVHPVAEMIERAHSVGAQVFVDAVHYAPHRSIDVTTWDCDYLACSVYKFFGPHVGLLWGKRQYMESLPVYKFRPASNAVPDRWMMGTQNHEGIAGAAEAVEYLADIGRSVLPDSTTRRAALVAAYGAISEYESNLVQRLIDGLSGIPGVNVWGIRDPERAAQRVPTVSLTHDRATPQEIAGSLAERGIFTWTGNFYAIRLIEALGLGTDGMLRIGLLHYNTEEEVDRLLEHMREI